MEVDPSTVIAGASYAPEIENRVRWYQAYRSASWRVDKTYVMVGGTWKYLFRGSLASSLSPLDQSTQSKTPTTE